MEAALRLSPGPLLNSHRTLLHHGNSLSICALMKTPTSPLSRLGTRAIGKLISLSLLLELIRNELFPQSPSGSHNSLESSGVVPEDSLKSPDNNDTETKLQQLKSTNEKIRLKAVAELAALNLPHNDNITQVRQIVWNNFVVPNPGILTRKECPGSAKDCLSSWKLSFGYQLVRASNSWDVQTKQRLFWARC